MLLVVTRLVSLCFICLLLNKHHSAIFTLVMCIFGGKISEKLFKGTKNLELEKLRKKPRISYKNY